jgi:hypothetical protein
MGAPVGRERKVRVGMQIAAAVRDLTPSVDALLEVIAARQWKCNRARSDTHVNLTHS